MRRRLTIVFAVLALVGLLAPPVFAQAPAPKVTIEGFLDQTTSYLGNSSIYDLDTTKRDDQWYARTRGRFQITGEIGKTKGVFLFEQDNQWGSAAGNTYGTNFQGGPWGRRDGNINTEILGNVEMLWMYTEFPLTGDGSLLPFVPVPGTARLGFQPFEDDTYKLGVLAFGNYGGVHVNLDLMPGLRYTGTYAQVNESLVGQRSRDNVFVANGSADSGFDRGDDFMMIHTVEFSPMKGLDIKPIYAYYFADGATLSPFPFYADGIYAGPRAGRGGVTVDSGFFPRGAIENRHTVGVDAKWTSGPWSFAPTFFYQFGNRTINTDPAIGGVANGASSVGCVGGLGGTATKTGVGSTATKCVDADISAWFLDLRGSWQAGPLTIEGMFVYTSGNTAKEDLRAGRTVHFYQPLVTDGVYGYGWGSITAIDLDYMAELMGTAAGTCLACSPSYDKYGRIQIGIRPSYQVTPAFKLRGVIQSLWTAEDVDTNSSTIAAGNGALPGLNPLGGVGPQLKGRDSYLGTELDFGFDWNFAPNISLLWVYGHMFTGGALDNGNCQVIGTCAAGTIKSAKDIDATTAVVRYTF